jgi:site-specific recombinase XerD
MVGMPARNLAPRTRHEYHNDLSDLLTFLEEREVVQLSAVRLLHLEMYLAALDQRQLRPASRICKTYAIKTFFSYLHEHGVTDTDVSARLIPPEVVCSEPRVLSEEEYKSLQRACRENTCDAAIIELYLQTGMNLSELVRLTLSDIELPKTISESLFGNYPTLGILLA